MRLHEFETDITITAPVRVVIDYFVSVPPNHSCWDSDMDYYGYTECEWHLEDDKGNRLKEVENLLTESDNDMILEMIEEEMEMLDD